MEVSNGLNPFLSWDTSIVGIQDEILFLGYANRLNGGVSLIGIFSNRLNPFLSWDISIVGIQDEVLGLGYASRLSALCAQKLWLRPPLSACPPAGLAARWLAHGEPRGSCLAGN